MQNGIGKISLTSKQAETLRALSDLRSRLKYAPTYVQIASVLGCDPSTLHRSIQVLQLKGAVQKKDGPRSLQLTPEGEAALCSFLNETQAPAEVR